MTKPTKIFYSTGRRDGYTVTYRNCLCFTIHIPKEIIFVVLFKNRRKLGKTKNNKICLALLITDKSIINITILQCLTNNIYICSYESCILILKQYISFMKSTLLTVDNTVLYK